MLLWSNCWSSFVPIFSRILVATSIALGFQEISFGLNSQIQFHIIGLLPKLVRSWEDDKSVVVGAMLNSLGKNYLSWVLDARCLGDIIKDENKVSKQEYAKTMIFLHHLDEIMKIDYLTVKDPLIL